MQGNGYIVVCRSDGGWHMATRQVWRRREDAKAYADTVALSRCAVVVMVPFSQLREADDKTRGEQWV